jgi:hypothetical protein
MAATTLDDTAPWAVAVGKLVGTREVGCRVARSGAAVGPVVGGVGLVGPLVVGGFVGPPVFSLVGPTVVGELVGPTVVGSDEGRAVGCGREAVGAFVGWADGVVVGDRLLVGKRVGGLQGRVGEAVVHEGNASVPGHVPTSYSTAKPSASTRGTRMVTTQSPLPRVLNNSVEYFCYTNI